MLPKLAPRVARSPMPQLGKASKEHTEAEWEAKRDIIRGLYITENRKLVDTMAIMRRRHDFSGT